MKFSGKEIKIIAIHYLAFIVTGMEALSIGAMLPALKSLRNLSYTFAGNLVSAHSIGLISTAFIFGYIAEKFGGKKSVVFFTTGSFLAYFIILVTRSPMLLYLAVLLTGISRGAITNFNNIEINKISKSDTRIMNILHATFSTGAFLFPLLYSFTIGANFANFDKIIIFMCILGIFQLVLYILYPSDTENNYVVAEKENGVQVISENKYGFFKDKDFYYIVLILFFYVAAEQATIGWLITYFEDTGILPLRFAQISSSIQWFMILIGRLVIASLSKSVKVKILYRMMATGFLVFCILLLLSRNPILIIISIAGLGFSMAGIFPTNAALSGDLVARYPLSWSFIIPLSSSGGIIMPIIIGFLSNIYGIYVGMSSIIIVTIISVVLMYIYSRYIN